MQEHPQPVDPAMIKYLRRLVTVLTGTMILGLLVIIVLFVIRFSGQRDVFPDNLTLPAGTQARAYTQAEGWSAIVTTDNRILIYDRETGAMMQEIVVTTE